MTGDKDAFIDIVPSFGSKVKLGNGEYVEVESRVQNLRMVTLFNLRIKSTEFLTQEEKLLLL
jgi:hypothetical protein